MLVKQEKCYGEGQAKEWYKHILFWLRQILKWSRKQRTIYEYCKQNEKSLTLMITANERMFQMKAFEIQALQ